MENTPKRQRTASASTPMTAKSIKVESDLWYDRCRYKCHFCPKVAKSRNKIACHLKDFHKQSGLGKGEGFDVLSQELLDCKLCGLSVVCDPGNVKQHMRVRHNIGVEEYETRYAVNC